jgi:hypothetical protein
MESLNSHANPERQRACSEKDSDLIEVGDTRDLYFSQHLLGKMLMLDFQDHTLRNRIEMQSRLLTLPAPGNHWRFKELLKGTIWRNSDVIVGKCPGQWGFYNLLTFSTSVSH